jgi:hypothetical protein
VWLPTCWSSGPAVVFLSAREEPILQENEELAHRQGEDGGLKGGRHAQAEGAPLDIGKSRGGSRGCRHIC